MSAEALAKKERKAIYQIQYRKKHKESLKIKALAYVFLNRDKILAKRNKTRKENPDAFNAAWKAWKHNNIEKLSRQRAIRSLKNKEQLSLEQKILRLKKKILLTIDPDILVFVQAKMLKYENLLNHIKEKKKQKKALLREEKGKDPVLRLAILRAKEKPIVPKTPEYRLAKRREYNKKYRLKKEYKNNRAIYLAKNKEKICLQKKVLHLKGKMEITGDAALMKNNSYLGKPEKPKLVKKKEEEIFLLPHSVVTYDSATPTKKTAHFTVYEKVHLEEMHAELEDLISKEKIQEDISIILKYFNKNRDPSKKPFVSVNISKVEFWIMENPSTMEGLRALTYT